MHPNTDVIPQMEYTWAQTHAPTTIDYIVIWILVKGRRMREAEQKRHRKKSEHPMPNPSSSSCVCVCVIRMQNGWKNKAYPFDKWREIADWIKCQNENKNKFHNY